MAGTETSTDHRPSTPSPTRVSATWSASGSVTTGVVLVLVGVVFLLQETLGLGWGNWWAAFIAIPGLVALTDAWRAYERNGREITPDVTRRALVGAVPLVVAGIFLFELDWGEAWPVFLIIAGLGAMSGAWKPGRA